MSGMCLGEKILAVLPPATAFDDPERNFQNKPVGDGEHVAYEIKVEDIHRPSAVEKLFSRAYRVWSQVAPFVAIIILVAIFAFFLRVISKMSSKNAVPAKVKRGKKGKKKGKKVRLKIFKFLKMVILNSPSLSRSVCAGHDDECSHGQVQLKGSKAGPSKTCIC